MLIDSGYSPPHQPARHHHVRHHHHPRRRMFTAVASYYNVIPGQSTACGIDVPHGVANLTMRCGTRLTICAARCALAIVDDRGPYVGGRTFDLSSSLAASIGFPFSAGVSTVRWAYGGPGR